MGYETRRVSLVEPGRVEVEDLVTHRFSLDEAARAFEAAVRDPGAVKVVITPSNEA